MIRLAALLALFVACGPGAKGGPSMSSHMAGPEPTSQSSPVVSQEIVPLLPRPLPWQ